MRSLPAPPRNCKIFQTFQKVRAKASKAAVNWCWHFFLPPVTSPKLGKHLIQLGFFRQSKQLWILAFVLPPATSQKLGKQLIQFSDVPSRAVVNFGIFCLLRPPESLEKLVSGFCDCLSEDKLWTKWGDLGKTRGWREQESSFRVLKHFQLVRTMAWIFNAIFRTRNR